MFNKRRTTPEEDTGAQAAAADLRKKDAISAAAKSAKQLARLLHQPLTTGQDWLNDRDCEQAAYQFLFNAGDNRLAISESPEDLATRIGLEIKEGVPLLEPYLTIPDFLLRGIRQNLVIYQIFAGPANDSVYTRRLCIERTLAILEQFRIEDIAAVELIIAFLRITENLPADQCYAFCLRLAQYRPGKNLSAEEQMHWRDRIIIHSRSCYHEEMARLLGTADQIQRTILARQ